MDLLNTVLSELGITGQNAIAVIAVVSILCRFVGKSIPDDRKGVLGLVRKACKILGLYVSNRLTDTCSEADVAMRVAKTPIRGPNGKFTSVG